MLEKSHKTFKLTSNLYLCNEERQNRKQTEITSCNPSFSPAWVESTIRNSNRRSLATSRCSHIVWTASGHASPVHHLTLTFSVWQFAHLGISHSGHISIVILMPVAQHAHCVLAQRLGIGSVRCLLRPKARTTHTVPNPDVSFPSCRGLPQV